MVDTHRFLIHHSVEAAAGFYRVFYPWLCAFCPSGLLSIQTKLVFEVQAGKYWKFSQFL